MTLWSAVAKPPLLPAVQRDDAKSGGCAAALQGRGPAAVLAGTIPVDSLHEFRLVRINY